MEDRSVNDSRSYGSASQEGSGHSSQSEEWDSGIEEVVEDDERSAGVFVHSEDSYAERSDESQNSGSMHTEHSASFHSDHSGSYQSEHSGSHHLRDNETFEVDDEDSQEESDAHESDDEFDASQNHLIQTVSEDTESQGMKSDDETDTCLLSIDEHVRRRYAKNMMKIREKPIDAEREFRGDVSEDQASHESRSDDETDTCMLSIDEHVRRRRQENFNTLRDGKQKEETIDLTCLDSYVGTLEETTIISAQEESVETGTVESRAMDSITMDSATFGATTLESRTVQNLPPVQEPHVDNKLGLDWRIANWRKDSPPVQEVRRADDRALKGVDYMSAFSVASTNRDISVVEPGISKKAAREAFEKKEVPDEIPVMLRDDVSSIYPPVRSSGRSTYPPKRKREPYNGMILEDVVSYDEELGDTSTKEYEMSIVGSEAKKKDMLSQRSDIELVLIGMISLSLLILVILLIVILAKNS